jgi:AraC family transcriptional regulator
MQSSFATVSEDDGVRMTSAEVNGFRLAELRFPPNYVQQPFEPDLPYLALVVDGSLQKTFRRRSLHLTGSTGVTMPAGAWHGARFGPRGAQIAIVKASDESSTLAGCLDRLTEVRGHGLTWLAWRLLGELHAADAAAPLAAEGFALELLAATTRETRADRHRGRPPRWLAAAEELLRASIGRPIRLGELATAAGVDPGHLARAFRAQYGLSVGEYGRRLRLAWAAAEIARTDAPLATVAAEAGFADQSHFTRLFRRYVGITPARYRQEARRVPN